MEENDTTKVSWQDSDVLSYGTWIVGEEHDEAKMLKCVTDVLDRIYPKGYDIIRQLHTVKPAIFDPNAEDMLSTRAFTSVKVWYKLK